MNPRLREVYMNAIREVINLPDGGKEVDRMYVPNVFAEVFAEQIVRECVNVCLAERDPSNLNYKPSEKFADLIKQHFGVK
jgi:hypothetical protein